MKAFWNQRYRSETFAYVKTPNLYFKQQLDRLKPGKLFLPAEGEGRNAVYAALFGWEVTAYDFREVAIEKAKILAKEKKVHFTYQNASLEQIHFAPASFDAIGIVFVQYPSEVRTKNFNKICSFLKPGGTLIMEVFSRNHLEYQQLNPSVGGPKNIDQLYDIKEIEQDFCDFDVLELSEEKTKLEEGEFHRGMASVIRFVGIKK